jgi:DNA-binding PadR family transcriptional regulator
MKRRFGHGDLHLVLLALLEHREMHGYELMSELANRMGRRYKPSPGSIYPAIASLEADGLIKGRSEGDRRIYVITQAGVQALQRRAEQLAKLEDDLGARFAADGADVALARFVAQARTLARDLPSERLDEVLNDAIRQLRTDQQREAR